MTPEVGVVGVPGNPTPIGNPPSSTTVTVHGVPIGLPGPDSGNPVVIIDGRPIVAPTNSGGGGGSATTVTAAGGEVFTVNPSQVIGEGTTITRPVVAKITPLAAVATAGSDPTLVTIATVVDGVTLTMIGSSIAVVDGTSFTIAAGVMPTTVMAGGVSVSIGPGGVGLPSTTVRPAVGGWGAGSSTIGGTAPTTVASARQGDGSVSMSKAATGTSNASPTKSGAGCLRYSYYGEILVMCMLLQLWLLV